VQGYDAVAMGQPIAVIEKPSSRRGIVRFETNRALTGMGHERYRADQDVWGTRPPDELARRLFARGGVAGVHVNGNIVTIDLEKGWTSDGLKEIVESLYIYYPPGAEEGDVADAVAAGSESADVADATVATVPTDAEGAEHAESVVDPGATHDPAGPAPADAEVIEAPEAPGATEADPALATDAGDAAPEPDASADPGAAVADPALAEDRASDDDEPDNDTSIADAARARSAAGSAPLPGNQSGPDDDPAASAPI